MAADWKPIPDATETLADGTRREWACRDFAPPPAPQVVTPPSKDYTLDPSDDEPVPQVRVRARRRDSLQPSDGGMVQSAMRASIESGVEFRRGATWKLWAPWIGLFIIIGLSVYAYGDDPRRQWWGASNSAPVDSARVGGSVTTGGGRGTSLNHCRELLEEFRVGDQRHNWTAEDRARVDAAIRADGGRP